MVEILSASLQSGAFWQSLTGIGPGGIQQPFKVSNFLSGDQHRVFHYQ
jgi:hypothetical protein